MANTKVVHDTDIGTGLEIAGGKVNVATSQATDAEVAAAISSSVATDSIEERQILDNIRYQDGILFTAPWELDGTKVKAHTDTGFPAAGYPRFLSISTKQGHLNFTFPKAGETVKGLGGLPDLTVDAQGFVSLPSWGVLWYKYAGVNTGWYYSTYSVAFDATVEYIRVFGYSHDHELNGYLADGTIVYQGMNYPNRVTSVAGRRLGMSTRRHTRNLGVFEGFIRNTLTEREGDFANATVSADSVLGNTVVHFKLPLKTGSSDASNQMYHLHFTGHALSATKKIIDTTVVGYAYSGATGVYGPEVYGTHAPEVTQYQGSDNHVYVRVAFGNAYCLTLSIDSMGVGNGFPLKHGSIQAIINPAATL